MNRQHDIDTLAGPSNDLEKIDAARRLSLYTHENRVMNALCAAAVRTDSRRLRDVLIEALRSNVAGACMRFSDDALWSQDPGIRKWALVNLGLLGCREATNAVISGLYDPDPTVRKAAAMNAGLYEDQRVQAAMTHFFERYRLDLTLAFISDGLNAQTCGTPASDDDVLSQTVLI